MEMGRHRVVVVDDNVRILKGLEAFVRRRGFSPIAFSSIDETCAAVEVMKEPPEAAVIDLWFGSGRLGFEIAGRLRARFSDVVPIRLITGHSVELLRLEEVAREFDAEILEKPIDSASLNQFLARAAALSIVRHAPVFHSAIISICDRYELAPQEARIVGHFAAGSTRASLASDLGVSHDTVKSQIRRLLGKARLRSTDQLVAVILQTAGAGVDHACHP